MDPRGGECAPSSTGSLYSSLFSPGIGPQLGYVAVNSNRLFFGSTFRLFSVQDEKLKALVQKLGTSDWKYIASYIPVSPPLLHTFYNANIHSLFYVNSVCRLTPSISVSIAGTSSWIQNLSKVHGPKKRMRRLVTHVTTFFA